MTLDETIKQFREDAENNRADLDMEFAKENDQVAEWLEELKEFKKQSRWIPVEERLPEDFEEYKGKKVIDVLVTTANGRVTKVQRKYDKWIGWYFARIYGDAKAWMPLPEPYKEGEQKC